MASRDDETERYRRAAEDALQQLDWCIGYLHGLRKLKISRKCLQIKMKELGLREQDGKQDSKPEQKADAPES